MSCPHCDSSNIRQCCQETTLGYEQYRCRQCGAQFNERSGTELNFIHYPTEVVMLVVHYYYRFKVSLDDVVELMLLRGLHLSHQTVSNWVQTFGVALGLTLRKKRVGQCEKRWHVDATYIKIEGRWCYLYRAIDKAGHLVDVYLSDVRNQTAAKKFFEQAISTSGVIPEIITTDKEPALYPAIKNIFTNKTKHRDSKYMNNCIERSHRGIKSRYKVMKGFKDIFNALRFCTVFEEVQQFFQMKNKTRSEKRSLLVPRIQKFNGLIKITT